MDGQRRLQLYQQHTDVFRVRSGQFHPFSLLLFGRVFLSITKWHFPPQTFKDHMIDGETLPLLSEEHLLDTLGLKLGPALKIRSQVGHRFRHGPKILRFTLSFQRGQRCPRPPSPFYAMLESVNVV